MRVCRGDETDEDDTKIGYDTAGLLSTDRRRLQERLQGNCGTKETTTNERTNDDGTNERGKTHGEGEHDDMTNNRLTVTTDGCKLRGNTGKESPRGAPRTKDHDLRCLG